MVSWLHARDPIAMLHIEMCMNNLLAMIYSEQYMYNLSH